MTKTSFKNLLKPLKLEDLRLGMEVSISQLQEIKGTHIELMNYHTVEYTSNMSMNTLYCGTITYIEGVAGTSKSNGRNYVEWLISYYKEDNTNKERQ